MNTNRFFDGKKIDPIEFVRTIGNIEEKLDIIISQLPSSNQPDKPASIGQQPAIIEISGMQAPWVIGNLKWDGKSEVYDEDELKAFLGFNPNDDDADGLSWCAGFQKRILEECGIDTTGLDLSAISFIKLGYEIDYGGDISNIPNGAFLVFQPKPGSRYKVSHVGVKVDDDKLYGGNQGDSAKRSNLAWYLANAELVAVRCPNGYKLT